MKKQKLFILGCFILSTTILQTSYVKMENQQKQIKTNEVAAMLKQNEIQEEDEVPLQEEIIEEKAQYVYNEIKICNSSSVKTYMNYQAITNKGSTQYKFIKNHMYVDERGLLRYNEDNDFIGIALGSSFGSIGSMYRITLDTGIVLNVIKVEAKADKHTNNGCEQMYDKSVIEFVIDGNIAKKHFGGSNGYVANGNFNNIKEFKGKIIQIERVYLNE